MSSLTISSMGSNKRTHKINIVAPVDINSAEETIFTRDPKVFSDQFLVNVNETLETKYPVNIKTGYFQCIKAKIFL